MKRLLVAAATCAPSFAFALGIRLSDQNPEATARGNAFAATADNPSAIYYNPSGIAQLEGTSILLGSYAISVETRVDLDAKGARSFSSTNDELQFAPQFFATWKPAQIPVAFGFGVYSPFGFSLDYPDDTAFRALAHKGEIEYLTFNPVIAVKVAENFSVGVGVLINYGRATLNRGVLAPGDEFRFRGDGTSVGFNAGLLWKPHPMHSFGVNYRSASNIDFDGRSHLFFKGFTVPTALGPFQVPGLDRNEDARVRFDFPQNVVLGYSFRPAPDWNFEFNYDWTDWNTLNDLVLHQKSGNQVLKFDWKSSAFYEFGVTKKFAHGLRVSGGYIYSENSVPNEFFNPIIPDSNRHILSIGVGQTLDHFAWDIAYQYAFGPDRTVSNGTAADGTYNTDSHAITLSIGYHF